MFPSWFEALRMLRQATRKTHPRAYQCIWDNYVILPLKYCNSTTLSIWVVYACVSKNAIVSKDVIFYPLRYNMILWSSHIYKKYYFLSFHSLLFLVNNTGKVTDLNWQCETLVNGMKNVIMHFFHGSMIYCSFLILLHIERKWLLMRNFATVLPLKSKLSGEFQHFNAVNESMEMLINS